RLRNWRRTRRVRSVCSRRRRSTWGSGAAATELLDPVFGHPVARPRYRLVGGMALGRGEYGSVVILVRREVPEPVLARVEGPDGGGSGVAPMCRRVPRQRVVAAADVPTCGAAAQVDPPAADRIAFDATGAARRYRGIDVGAHR